MVVDLRPLGALSLDTAQTLDREDPLAWLREYFFIAEDGKIYLDGNSLGRLPKDIREAVEKFLLEEWWTKLVDGREQRLDLAVRLWNRIGKQILGAREWETLLSDNVTTNIFKLLWSLCLNGKTKIFTHQGNFPTDKYMCDAMPRLFPGVESLRFEEDFEKGVTVEDIKRQLDALGGEAKNAVFLISHVDYRSGALVDMKWINEAAHAAWAVVIWDLCHSAWVVPIDFDENKCDFAVGCTYKYLNSWPGTLAFVSVAQHHIPNLEAIIPGRWAQTGSDQFAFHDQHMPAGDIRILQTWTPSITNMELLIASLDVYQKTTIQDLRLKSQQLTEFARLLLVQELSEHGVEVITPSDPEERGSHISFTHQYAKEIWFVLREQNVVPDFRPPNIVRIWLAPLYTTYEEVYAFVQKLKLIIGAKEYLSASSLQMKNTVT